MRVVIVALGSTFTVSTGDSQWMAVNPLRSLSRPSHKGTLQKTSGGRIALFLALVISMTVVSSSASPSVSHALNSGGLVFQDFDGTGESWSVTGCDGTCADPLVIPSVVNGKPVVGIGSSSFWYDYSLAQVQIPASVTTISGYAFGGSMATTFSVDPLSQHFKSVDGMLLTKDGTELVAHPGGALALDGQGVTSVTVPTGVRKLRMGAFYSGNRITSVSLPASLEEIEQQVFYLNNLSTIELPISLTTIGLDAFGPSLTSFTVNAGNTTFSATDGVLFKGTSLFRYPPQRSATSYSVPVGTTEIEPNAFDRASLIDSLNLPASISRLTDASLTGLSNLASIAVNVGNTTFSTTDGVLFKDTTLVKYPSKKIETSYSVPAGTTEIESNAFDSAGLIDSLNLPASMSTLSIAVFTGLSNLASIAVNVGNTTFSTIDGVLFRGTTLVKYPKAKAGTTYSVPAGTTEIGESAFGSTPTLTTITLPDSITVIGSGAFENTYNLEIINLPSRLVSLGTYSLTWTKITSIVVPHTVSDWGWQPFGYNRNPSSTAFDIYFEGDAPPEGVNLGLPTGAIVHRIEGTNGWPTLSDTYRGYTQAAWSPNITTPRAPSVSALAESVRVTANRGSGGLPTSYLVTASPNGETCTIATGETSCVVSGLTAGTPYTFTTTATKGATTTASSATSAAISPLTSQTITFADPIDREFSSTPFSVNPTSNSNLSVTLTSTTQDVCTVSGFNVTMLAEGTCTLAASQEGNSSYAAATDVVHSFTISPVPETPTTTTPPTPTPTTTTPPPTTTTPPTPTPTTTTPPTPTPIVSATGTPVSIARMPSGVIATAVAIGVNKTKVMVALKVPTATKPTNQVTKYVITLKSSKGAIITRTISVKAGASLSPTLTGKKKTTYSMTVTAVTKSGKKTTWKGPQVKTP